MATKKTESKRDPRELRYFIVNPAGAVHEVTYERAKDVLRLPGYRMASREEIEAYKNAPAHTGFGPIAPRWEPEPEPEPAPEGVE